MTEYNQGWNDAIEAAQLVAKREGESKYKFFERTQERMDLYPACTAFNIELEIRALKKPTEGGKDG